MDNLWDCILSVLVIIHLCSEYIHYFLEWFSSKKEKSVLLDIQNHRKASNKTELLVNMQTDINLIKEKLGITD